MIKPAYPKRQFLILNVLAIVIILFIQYDDLTNFKKICMVIHFIYSLKPEIYLAKKETKFGE